MPVTTWTLGHSDHTDADTGRYTVTCSITLGPHGPVIGEHTAHLTCRACAVTVVDMADAAGHLIAYSIPGF